MHVKRHRKRCYYILHFNNIIFYKNTNYWKDGQVTEADIFSLPSRWDVYCIFILSNRIFKAWIMNEMLPIITNRCTLYIFLIFTSLSPPFLFHYYFFFSLTFYSTALLGILKKGDYLLFFRRKKGIYNMMVIEIIDHINVWNLGAEYCI